MTIPVAAFLSALDDEPHPLEIYQGGMPRWCTGCGDNAILAAVQDANRPQRMPELHPQGGS